MRTSVQVGHGLSRQLASIISVLSPLLSVGFVNFPENRDPARHPPKLEVHAVPRGALDLELVPLQRLKAAG